MQQIYILTEIASLRGKISCREGEVSPVYFPHNIDLNYVFGGVGRMLREGIEKGVKPDFGKYTEEIDDLLFYMSRVPHALYAVLGYFTEYKPKNKQLLNEFLTKVVLVCIDAIQGLGMAFHFHL